MPNDEIVNVRYMVDDVDEAIAFYTKLLGFELLTSASPAFADVKRGNLRLLLAGPKSSAGRPMPDGRTARTGRLEPHPLHRRRHRRRGDPAPRRRRDVPQRHRDRARAASRSCSRTRRATSSSCSSPPCTDRGDDLEPWRRVKLTLTQVATYTQFVDAALEAPAALRRRRRGSHGWATAPRPLQVSAGQPS